MTASGSCERPILQGPAVRLRPPAAKDARWRQRLGYDPEIVRMFGGDYAIADMSAADAERWAEGLIADPHGWIIEVSGQGIGEIRLHRVDLQDQCASLAIGILDRAQLGRGIGREAISLLARHAFTGMGLHRLATRVLAFNERAIRCYRACGFQIEGRERETCRIGGERFDDIMMGLLKREFRDLQR